MAGKSVEKKVVRTERAVAPSAAAPQAVPPQAVPPQAVLPQVAEVKAVELQVVEAQAGYVGVPDAGVTPPELVVSAPVKKFEGYIDGLDAHWHVVGWVRSLLGVNVRLQVELVENERVVSSDTAMRFRGDLLDAGHGDGNYGFQLSIASGLFDGLRHSLAVRLRLPGEESAVLGQLDIVLPSRLPKTSRGRDAALPASAAKLVEGVLGGGTAQTAQYLDTYIQQLTKVLDAVVREYDFATALGLLYVHILRRHIDEGGLQTRLTRLSTRPAELGDVVREVVHSDEAQGRIKKPSGYHLPDLEAVRAWTRLRPIT